MFVHHKCYCYCFPAEQIIYTDAEHGFIRLKLMTKNILPQFLDVD